MANNLLRQYRRALKAYEKKISEFVSYEGRTYSSEYYEFQGRISRMEIQIKNRTYTNKQLQYMINKMGQRSISVEHTRQYDVEKGKFVRTSETKTYEKRKGGGVATPSQARAEVEKREAIRKPPADTGDTGSTTDYYGAFYVELYLWCMRNPRGEVNSLIGALRSLARDDRLINAFEKAAARVGLNHIPYGYDDIKQLTSIAELAYAIYELPEDSEARKKLEELVSTSGSNYQYDNEEFGERK